MTASAGEKQQRSGQHSGFTEGVLWRAGPVFQGGLALERLRDSIYRASSGIGGIFFFLVGQSLGALWPQAIRKGPLGSLGTSGART